MISETIVINSERNVTLTTYIPDISREMSNMTIKPAVLVIPGGAYKFCSDREAEPVALFYIANGFNAFILRYSLNEDSAFPNPLTDAENAMKMIIDNSEKWHTDPNRIAVCGFSAGGHLAAALSTIGVYKPAACILGYPCILSSTSNVLAKPIPSIEQSVSHSTPPTFIFAASNDSTVQIDNSLIYALELKKNNVPFELHIFNDGGHGFSLATEVVCSDIESRKSCSDASYWSERSIKWLKDIM